MSLLPSDEVWLERVANQLLDGEILLLRGLPRSGKSTICSWLAELLGPSSYMVKGREITEGGQLQYREQLDVNLAELIDQHGAAQLLFDDYGQAVRRSQGGALHSLLFRLLVDGENARDTGALLTCRFREDLSVTFSGSPLLSRTRSVTAPLLGEADARALDAALDELQQSLGCSTSLARRLGSPEHPVRTYEIVEYLANDKRAVVDDLPPQAVEVMIGARNYDQADAISRQALLMLGSPQKDGSFHVASTVRDAGLLNIVTVRSPGWPPSFRDSVEAFVALVAGASDAIWVDRYLLADVDRLRGFLKEVRARTQARIRLLCDGRDSRGWIPNAASLEDIPGVEVRFIRPADRPSLHDRHLVLPAARRGFVLPTARVIFGQDPPGSTVAVPIPNLAVDYSAYWVRANKAA